MIKSTPCISRWLSSRNGISLQALSLPLDGQPNPSWGSWWYFPSHGSLESDARSSETSSQVQQSVECFERLSTWWCLGADLPWRWSSSSSPVWFASAFVYAAHLFAQLSPTICSRWQLSEQPVTHLHSVSRSLWCSRPLAAIRQTRWVTSSSLPSLHIPSSFCWRLGSSGPQFSSSPPL